MNRGLSREGLLWCSVRGLIEGSEAVPVLPRLGHIEEEQNRRVFIEQDTEPGNNQWHGDKV